MIKYSNLMLKPSRVPGGVLLVGDDKLRGIRFFFVNEKGVHECPRTGTVEQAIAGAVLVDCNPRVLEACLKRLAELEAPAAPVEVKP
jgi:hypothetical protein